MRDLLANPLTSLFTLKSHNSTEGSAAALLPPGLLQKVTSTRNTLRIGLHVNGSKHGSSKFLPATPLRNLAIRLFSRCPVNQSVRLSNKIPHKSPGINSIAKINRYKTSVRQ